LDPPKVCSGVNRIITGLTTWMKNFINFVQIWMKYVSMELNVMDFWWEGMLWLLNGPWDLGKHSGAKAAKCSGRRCCVGGVWSGVVQRQQVRHIFWSFLLWSKAFIHSLLSSCLLITLPLVSKCYWLCFEWHFEWFGIGIID
jgi:hypothetical protein